MHGFHRVASAVNRTVVANPTLNAREIFTLLEKSYKEAVSIVVFPELTLTGYTASDLLLNQTLLNSQKRALESLLQESQNISTVAIIGYALVDGDRLYNCAVVIQNGEILGVVPKSYLPNKKEFYEKRQFISGRDIVKQTTSIVGREVPFGVDLLFSDNEEMLFGVEICEDLWAVTPPSNHMASNGANLIFNLSASNELIGKAEYREELVRTQSARCMGAYVYSSAGVGESTTDTVFGGHAIICEYGSTIAQNRRFLMDSTLTVADIDLQKLRWLRLNESSYCDSRKKPTRTITISPTPKIEELRRFINPMPFVPSVNQEKKQRCEEIIQIQAHGLIKRVSHAKIKKAVIKICLLLYFVC